MKAKSKVLVALSTVTAVFSIGGTIAFGQYNDNSIKETTSAANLHKEVQGLSTTSNNIGSVDEPFEFSLIYPEDATDKVKQAIAEEIKEKTTNKIIPNVEIPKEKTTTDTSKATVPNTEKSKSTKTTKATTKAKTSSSKSKSTKKTTKAKTNSSKSKSKTTSSAKSNGSNKKSKTSSSSSKAPAYVITPDGRKVPNPEVDYEGYLKAMDGMWKGKDDVYRVDGPVDNDVPIDEQNGTKNKKIKNSYLY